MPESAIVATGQRNDIFSRRYKTALCRAFNEPQGCPYAEHCVFAHGESELRSEQANIDAGLRRGSITLYARVKLGDTPAIDSCTDRDVTATHTPEAMISPGYSWNSGVTTCTIESPEEPAVLPRTLNHLAELPSLRSVLHPGVATSGRSALVRLWRRASRHHY